jgi:hypothetical protein
MSEDYFVLPVGVGIHYIGPNYRFSGVDAAL